MGFISHCSIRYKLRRLQHYLHNEVFIVLRNFVNDIPMYDFVTLYIYWAKQRDQ
jgi:hypothetical protein